MQHIPEREIYRGVLRIQLQGHILGGAGYADKKQYHRGKRRQARATAAKSPDPFLHGLFGQQVNIPHPR